MAATIDDKRRAELREKYVQELSAAQCSYQEEMII